MTRDEMNILLEGVRKVVAEELAKVLSDQVKAEQRYEDQADIVEEIARRIAEEGK